MKQGHRFILKMLLLCFATFQHNANAHWDDAYNADESSLPAKTDWMNDIPDTTPLRELSIPGTRISDDDYFHKRYIEEMHQVMSINNQINGGIRFIEVRAQLINSTISLSDPYDYYFQKKIQGRHSAMDSCGDPGIICKTYEYASKDLTGCKKTLTAIDGTLEYPYGSPLSCEYSLRNLLDTLRAFLSQHPSETILLKMGGGGDIHNNRSYDEILNQIINDYSDIIWAHDSDNPTLGDVRGEVVLINERSGGKSSGIPYSSFSVQPDFHMNTNWDLYHRWELIKEKLNAAKDNKQFGIINYLTGWGGSFSYFVASGHSSPQNGAPRLLTGKTTPGWNDDVDFPRVGCLGSLCSIAFEGTNILTKEYLQKYHPTYAGIIVADFPGSGLIQAVIDANQHK
ncbi:MAG: hypothetical protein ACPGUD_08155 [Parashewanella sp.]